MKCQARDLMSTSQRRITDEGYLVAPANLSRTGVQVYTRGELGLDGDPNAIIRLMREAKDVFEPESVSSFESKPITDGHPTEWVTSRNWREKAFGEVRDVKPADPFLGANVVVKDDNAVAKIVSGKSALSNGYSFDLDLTPGEGFDGYQRNIRGNHVAIVDVARGGPNCRIADNGIKEIHMSTRKIVVDGLPLELEEIQAAAVENALKRQTADSDKLAKEYTGFLDSNKVVLAAKDAAITEKDKAIAAKDAEIADLNAKLAKINAVDIDALVAERTQVITDAAKIAPDLKPAGSSHEIRKAAIAVACAADATNKIVYDAVFGTEPIDKATESQVKGVFAAILALPKQAALAAQDRAVGVAMSGGSLSAESSGGEVLFGNEGIN